MGLFEVWGIRFDPRAGRAVGEPFRVSRFESPSLRMMGPEMPPALSFAAGRLMLPMTETAGSIWMLEATAR